MAAVPFARGFDPNLHLELSLSGLFAFAAPRTDPVGMGGVQGRLALRYGPLGLAAGVGYYLSSLRYPVPGKDAVTVERYPIVDVGPRWHVEWRRLRVVVQGSFVFIPVVAVPSSNAATSSPWEWGLGLGIEFHVAVVRQLDLFLGLSGTLLLRQAMLEDLSSKPAAPVDAVYPPLTASMGFAWSIR